MPSKLKTGLTMANPNDFVLVEKNINDNLIKIDDDIDATWGGEYGGYIQDTSVAKVVGKRYIDRFDKKAYECLVPSHENTITNYQACNVKDNLSKLNNLITINRKDKTTVYKFQTGEMLIFGKTEVVGPNEVTEIFATKFIHTPIVTGTYVGTSVDTNVIVVSNKTNSTQVTFNKTGSVGSIGGPVHYIASGVWK